MKVNIEDIGGEVVKQDEHFGLTIGQLKELEAKEGSWAINGSDIPMDDLLTPITATVMGKFLSGWLELR